MTGRRERSGSTISSSSTEAIELIEERRRVYLWEDPSRLRSTGYRNFIKKINLL